MEKSAIDQMLENEIQNIISTILPHGAALLTVERLRYALETISNKSFSAGQHYALMSLKTTEQIAEEFGVSLRRAQALVKDRHAKLGIGFQARGKDPWLFTAEEAELLRPAAKGGRPRKTV